MVSLEHIARELAEGLEEMPALDAHTHLTSGRLSAQGLHDILLYHMSVSDLYAAGCPSGGRLTPFPGEPSRVEAHARIMEALAYLPMVRNTSTAWAIRIILSELYDWQEAVTPENWEQLDGRIRERARDGAWPRDVLTAARIRKSCTEWARRCGGADDGILEYSLEWAFFTRCQWGEYDTALYELERSWGVEPGCPMPIHTGPRPKPQRQVNTLNDVRDAVAWYVSRIPAGRVLSVATHISTDIDFIQVTDAEMSQALKRRVLAGPLERDIYASYIQEAFLSELEKSYGEEIAYQFSYGAEPLPHETASRLSQRSITQLANMVERHPRVRFQCYLASAHANQGLCTLCRELPNLSMVGFWWHNFFPSVMRRIIDERLDMLPLNRQIGFFSDAYCVEWAYAKLALVKRAYAEALASRVASGQYRVDEAIDIARELLYEAPIRLTGMTPCVS